MNGRVINSVEYVERCKKHTMEADTSGAESASFEEIAEKMGAPRRSILALLNEGDSEDSQSLNSQEIRRATGVSPGSIRHHLKRLEDEWGLVEEVGREETGAGGAPAKVFGLTDRGRRYLGSAPAEEEPAVGSLNEMTQRVDRMEARLNQLEDDVAELNEKLESVVPVIEDIAGQLEGRKD